MLNKIIFLLKQILMSGQNTLLVIAADAEVKRPANKWNWQVYRDTAAPGSGTYKAMDFNGVVEIIGGPGFGSWGVYIPATTNIANVDSSVASECQWNRVGNVVTVSGQVQIDPTITNTTTILELDLPIASNFNGQNNCGGAFTSQSFADIAVDAGCISANGATDKARFTFRPVSIINLNYFFSFTYQIK